MKSLTTLLLLTIFLSWKSMAREPVYGQKTQQPNVASKLVSGCAAPVSKIDLDVNNVRTQILTGGDYWFDPASSLAAYEVPINSGKHSLYAGSIWIGGFDAAGNLKVSAQTYRQSGFDFYPGAINKSNNSITPERCQYYDRFWKIKKSDVLDFIADKNNITSDIKSYPGNGNAFYNEDEFLAPFHDANGDNIYNPAEGDYPLFRLNDKDADAGGGCNDFLFGDECIWWVINDIGNEHTVTKSGKGAGIEIQCQAFAFRTNNELNNMTFNKFKIINRGDLQLNETYFGSWVDPDLGNFADDYIGCDVSLGLGFVYNADNDDETALGYGVNPPALGIDFFQGPLADAFDLIDNDRDGEIDEPGEQIIMSKFIYYNNTSGPQGDPTQAFEHYNYLKGIWKNGQQLTYGKNGFIPGNAVCDFVYSDNTDTAFINNPDFPWTENSAGNPSGDRRFLQSAGPFTLLPGAVNYITIGVIWARAASGGPTQSVALVKFADAKAQQLFDNCFKVIDGPRAPDVAIRELDREIIISLENYFTPTTELYSEIDITIPDTISKTIKVIVDSIVQGNIVTYIYKDVTYTDTLSDEERSFKFEGYQIYQLKDESITYDILSLQNPDKARLIAQYDLKNNVGQIINHTWNMNLNTWDDIEMVNGKNEGLQHTLRITQDAFGGGANQLINYKNYYFTVIAYAYNEYEKFQFTPYASPNFSQKNPFMAGRTNVRTYTGIPHKSAPENYGQLLQSEYGTRPQMQRLAGTGNGGLTLELHETAIVEALSAPDYRSYFPLYKVNGSPVNISVYDPVKVKPLMLELKFDGITEGQSGWAITNASTNQMHESQLPFGVHNEQLFPDWGLAAEIENEYVDNGNSGITKNNNPLLNSYHVYENNNRWLNFVADNNLIKELNWIRAGELPYKTIDPEKIFETVINGTWAPFRLCSNIDTISTSPKYASSSLDAMNTLSKLASVDIVFTNDKSKWTRCAVLETCSDKSKAAGNAAKLDIRKSPSIDKDGKPSTASTGSDNSNDANFISATGMSWFPGYAINIETGERLNICFGENSALDSDMKFNPGTEMTDSKGNYTLGNMQYIYIFNHVANDWDDVPRYDYGRVISRLLHTGIANDKRAVFKDCIWTALPMLIKGHVMNESDIAISIRINKRYSTYDTRQEIFAGENLEPGKTYMVMVDSIQYQNTMYAAGTKFTANNSSTFSGYGSVVAGDTINKGFPYYKISLEGIDAIKENKDAANSALDLLNVVPNPYYAYSAYEKNQLDSRIKITNLPSRCTVTITGVNGQVIRKYKRDVGSDNSTGATTLTKNDDTSLEWDLKNHKGVPVASGIYLIHVEVPNVGARVLKSMLVMRPVDIDTY